MTRSPRQWRDLAVGETSLKRSDDLDMVYNFIVSREPPSGVRVYLGEKLEEDVVELLDDPVGMLGSADAAGVMEHIQRLHDIARYLGRGGVSDVIAELSGRKGLEFKRLMEIISEARLKSGVSIVESRL